MFSAISTDKVRQAIGFDPDHSNWIVATKTFECELDLYDHDFSDHQFSNIPQDSLIYFDDHINSARRILEAQARGFKHIIFDDSCGLTGTAERRWPSLPSLFFIINIHLFEEGDFLEWPHSTFSQYSFRENLIRIFLRSGRSQNTFRLTSEIIDLCNDAKIAVQSWSKIPDLNDYIVTETSSQINDSTQHFVVLA